MYLKINNTLISTHFVERLLKYKDVINQPRKCRYCESLIDEVKILFQGIHIGITGKCNKCDIKIYEDLKIGHSIYAPMYVNLSEGIIEGKKEYLGWYGKRLLDSILNPNQEKVKLNFIVKNPNMDKSQSTIILNCIDSTYGHVLLKLFNIKNLHFKYPDSNLIVIIPPNVKWLIPDYVDEVWELELPLKKLEEFYPDYNNQIHEHLKTLAEIYFSHSVPEPVVYDISDLTGVPPHNFEEPDLRITFVWREDRLWAWDSYHSYKSHKVPLINPLLWVQKRRIIKLFKSIRRNHPEAKFTVAGFGAKYKFPNWIEDCRYEKFNSENEKTLCKIYSESRLLIGVHGSSMIIPSAHAGIIINLIPIFKWLNFAEDIILRKDDPKITNYKYQFLSASTGVSKLAKLSSTLLGGLDRYFEHKIHVPNKYD